MACGPNSPNLFSHRCSGSDQNTNENSALLAAELFPIFDSTMTIPNNVLYSVCVISLIVSGCQNTNEEKPLEITAGQEPEKSFTINSDSLKRIYKPDEELILTLSLKDQRQYDSVKYWLNGFELATVSSNEVVRHQFSKEKFGKQIIKARVFDGEESDEQSISVDLLSAWTPTALDFRIVNTFPHDIKAYTQGLEFYRGNLIESTGNGVGPSGDAGISSVRIVDPRTGKPIKLVELDETIFGEGATVLNDKLYQLTYENNIAYVYDATTLETVRSIPYFQPMEGWGLTNDGTYLYMSDGTEYIYKIDAGDFSKIDFIRPATNTGVVGHINEMEWVNGRIFANIYLENVIAIIDPLTGTVEHIIDLSALKEKVTQHIDLDVLNGIAYNPDSKTYFVTGKNWDKMFEIEILFDS